MNEKYMDVVFTHGKESQEYSKFESEDVPNFYKDLEDIRNAMDEDPEPGKQDERKYRVNKNYQKTLFKHDSHVLNIKNPYYTELKKFHISYKLPHASS